MEFVKTQIIALDVSVLVTHQNFAAIIMFVKKSTKLQPTSLHSDVSHKNMVIIDSLEIERQLGYKQKQLVVVKVT